MIWEVNSLRVHELAKKHDMSSKDMLTLAINMGIDVSSTLSGLKEEDIKKIESELAAKNKKPVAEIKTAAEKKEVSVQNGAKKAVESEQQKGHKLSEKSKEYNKVGDVEAGKDMKSENTGKAEKTENNMAEKKDNNKIQEKKISEKNEKKDIKTKVKKVDLIPDVEEVDLDKKKPKKHKIEEIVEEEGVEVIVGKDKKAKHTDKPKPNFQNKPQQNKPFEKKEEKKVEEEIKSAVIPEEISMKDFAEKIGHNPAEIIKKLFLKGQIFTKRQ